jgi:hypothetical protein
MTLLYTSFSLENGFHAPTYSATLGYGGLFTSSCLSLGRVYYTSLSSILILGVWTLVLQQLLLLYLMYTQVLSCPSNILRSVLRFGAKRVCHRQWDFAAKENI